MLAAEDAAIGEDLGQLYVKKAFSPAAKARAQTMVEFTKQAMRERVRSATWMSQATKAEAFKKLDTMRSKVGYPDKWRDYGKLDIARRPYVRNALAANAFEFQRQLAKLGKPVDRSEWNMTPPTNNAYYEPTLNEMCFPAGILQPPFFDEKADDATNYGAIGATMGHELTHGFDDQGRQYDSQGNLKNWWTDDDAKGFQARAERVAKQYDAFEVLPGLHINGQQTLGENIADIGGLRVPTRPSSSRPRAKNWRPPTVSRRTSGSSSPLPRAGEPTSVPRRCVCTWVATCIVRSAGGCSDRWPIFPSFFRPSAARNRPRSGRRSGSGRMVANRSRFSSRGGGLPCSQG